MSKRKHFYKERSTLKANKEARGGRVLKIFRRVDQDDVSLVGGALVELADSGDIPALKPARSGLQAYIFDPRLMDRNINQGIVAGYKLSRLLAMADQRNTFLDEGYDVELDDFGLLGRNRKTILAKIKSERLITEREGLYRILGEQGVRGFSSDGKRSGHRHRETPTLSIGTFVEPVSQSSEKSIVEAISTVMDVQFSAQAGTSPSVGLGNVDIKTYKHR